MGKYLTILCGDPCPLKFDVASHMVKANRFRRVDGYELMDMMSYAHEIHDHCDGVITRKRYVPYEDDPEAVLAAAEISRVLFPHNDRVLVTSPTNSHKSRNLYIWNSAGFRPEAHIIYISAEDHILMEVSPERVAEEGRHLELSCRRMKPCQVSAFRHKFSKPYPGSAEHFHHWHQERSGDTELLNDLYRTIDGRFGRTGV